jgi:hypothetical protein
MIPFGAKHVRSVRWESSHVAREAGVDGLAGVELGGSLPVDASPPVVPAFDDPVGSVVVSPPQAAAMSDVVARVPRIRLRRDATIDCDRSKPHTSRYFTSRSLPA